MRPVSVENVQQMGSGPFLAGKDGRWKNPTNFTPGGRLDALEAVSRSARSRTECFVQLAQRGLPRMRKRGGFGYTLRGLKTHGGPAVRLEGDSLRYAAIVALGLSCTDTAAQQQVLNGGSAADLARVTATRAELSDDPGAIALAAWAAAEAANYPADRLFHRLSVLLSTNAPMPTVDCSWILSAAIAARHLGDTLQLANQAVQRLGEAQGPFGLFPHILPASSSGRLRAHVGCFADQVYPIQALARFHSAYGTSAALVMADACANRICELQGSAGQWWWHYDVRDGQVVEGYPVYSVHQHAMAPMALLDLQEAGGRQSWNAIIKGLDWLDRYPEVAEPLVSEELAVIWRKVGRREPRKAVRAIATATTALKPGLRLPWLNAAFPPTSVDRECRPYELGWLLYAWLFSGNGSPLRQPAG